MYDSELAEEEERRRKRAPWGVIALVLLTGLALIRNGSGEFDVGPPQPASAAASDTRSAVGDGAAAGVTPLPYSVPDQVSIPAIQVDAPVMGVGLDADGWVDAPPPEDPNLAGWFTGAVSPGEKGTAVVVGHVDNQQGPAVFYGLGALKKGNKVEVHRQDGKTAVFEIYGIEVFEKNNFPGDRVYGSKGSPELRVITCGGGFTKQNGYDGNVVAFARLVEVR
ncbi:MULTISPECIES: class F sortase [Streptomyces]|uniref:Secreted protein n=5 Tax=Streptomyces TaxID=1883 RepID=Q9RCX5_STRCO|nr:MULTISPECIES: class F sortase [Streptomyces]WOZ02271.1 class F sortase [Streptomyces violaceoruber]MBQ0949078.1 class F sortase [Streptomyces sp. RK76]MCW8116180.1 class F sortase [Streptomyces anthocyanicus]MCZ4634581.1 class F sortase [Streptomyces rubrogriseus]MDX2923292.1 class F sortase [Streptomyces sp. NRRL_B-16638]